ncbi:hypothetical protein BD779DRAFT_1473778 [Infundibulicybe gibba]|nr:hypothetical protein BD779DRAFT_1473778 [Infundibulicybe gibba]
MSHNPTPDAVVQLLEDLDLITYFVGTSFVEYPLDIPSLYLTLISSGCVDAGRVQLVWTCPRRLDSIIYGLDPIWEKEGNDVHFSRAMLSTINPWLSAGSKLLVRVSIGIWTVIARAPFIHLGHVSLTIPLPGCQSSAITPAFTFYAVPTFFMSFIMFAMTVRYCGRDIIHNNRIHMPRFVRLFLRDGISWFLIVLLNANLSARPTLAYARPQ